MATLLAVEQSCYYISCKEPQIFPYRRNEGNCFIEIIHREDRVLGVLYPARLASHVGNPAGLRRDVAPVQQMRLTSECLPITLVPVKGHVLSFPRILSLPR